MADRAQEVEGALARLVAALDERAKLAACGAKERAENRGVSHGLRLLAAESHVCDAIEHARAVLAGEVQPPAETEYLYLGLLDAKGKELPFEGEYRRVRFAVRDDGPRIVNAQAVDFPHATTDWPRVVGIFVADTPTGDEHLSDGPCNPAAVLHPGERVSFLPGAVRARRDEIEAFRAMFARRRAEAQPPATEPAGHATAIDEGTFVRGVMWENSWSGAWPQREPADMARIRAALASFEPVVFGAHVDSTSHATARALSMSRPGRAPFYTMSRPIDDDADEGDDHG